MLAAGTWHHVAYTFDGTAQRQVLYLDGGQVASSATTLAAGYDTQSLYLGRDTENGAPNYFLQGSLDEAAVYSRALTHPRRHAALAATTTGSCLTGKFTELAMKHFSWAC